MPVYFIQPVGGGPIKIGCSKSPRGRLGQMMIWSPVPLRIIAQCDGSFEIERHIHARLKNSRLHGEWFDTTPDLLEVITLLQSGFELPADWRPLPKKDNRTTFQKNRTDEEWQAFVLSRQAVVARDRSAKVAKLTIVPNEVEIIRTEVSS